MAGDWIKMRTNLDTDPRTYAVSRATGAHPAHVVGALHWLWSQADKHTSTGKLWGLSSEQVDKEVGIDGFCKALTELSREGKPRPWLEIGDGFVAVLRFGEHNTDSAKRRALGAVRASRFRNAKSNAPALRSAHLEQEQDKRREEREPALQDKAGAHRNGLCPALASPGALPDPRVEAALHRFWRTKPYKARQLAAHPGATIERVTWLIRRCRMEGVARPAGFIEKGITEEWPVDPEFLAKFNGQQEH